MEIQSQRSVDDWRKELAVMSQNRSPYVAEVYGYSTNQNILTIVMEFFPHGDLYTILHKKSQIHPLSTLQVPLSLLHLPFSSSSPRLLPLTAPADADGSSLLPWSAVPPQEQLHSPRREEHEYPRRRRLHLQVSRFRDCQARFGPSNLQHR